MATLATSNGAAVSWVGRALAAASAVAAMLLVPAVSAHAVGGTAVCGTLPSGTTTWTATGSPYNICANGITIPSDGTLTIDATLGSVAVTAPSTATIHVDGTLQTAHTSPIARVTMGPTSDGTWGGVFAYADTPTVSLDGVDVTNGPVDGYLDSFSFTNSTTNNSVNLTAVTATVTGSTFTSVACSPGAGVGSSVSLHSRDYVSTATVTFTNNKVSGGCGVRVLATSGTVTGNQVDSVSGEPAMTVSLDHPFTLGPTGTVGSNSGVGDQYPYMQLSGNVSGGFTWLPPPGDDSVRQPLGYVPDLVTASGNGGVVTVPANASELVAQLSLFGIALDASSGGASFTCPATSSVYQCQTLLTSVNKGGGIVLNHATVNGNVYTGTDVVGGTTDTGTGQPASLSMVASRVTGTVQTTDANTTITGSTLHFATLTAGDGQAITVTGNTADGFDAEAHGTGTVSVTGNTVHDDTAVPGNPSIPITVTAQPFGSVTVTNNTVAGSNRGGLMPAISVWGPGLRLGPGGNLDGNVGAGNGSDSIQVAGTLAQSATWAGPRHNSTTGPLGLLVGQSLTVPSGLTFTVPADTTVQSGPGPYGQPSGGGITLQGATFDASAGGAHFVNIGLALAGDTQGNASTGAITDADGSLSISYDAPSPAANGPMSTPGVTIDGLDETDLAGKPIGGETEITSSGAPLAISGLVMRGQVYVDQGSGTTIDRSVIYGAAQQTAVKLQDSTATITKTRLLDNAGWGVQSTGAPGQLTMSCDVVTGNGGGISAQTGGSLHDSSVHDNLAHVPYDDWLDTQYDVVSGDSVLFDASSVWWGQSGGPTPGQTHGDVVATSPLDAPPACTDEAPEPPAVPAATGLSATATSPHSVHLSWTNPTDDPDFSGVTVRMAKGSTPPATETDGVEVYNGTGQTVDVNALGPATTYAFTVFSHSTYTSRTSSASTTVTTPPLDTTGVAATVAPSTVVVGHAATVSATITDTTTAQPVANAPATLQSRLHGATQWHNVHQFTAGPDGVVSTSVSPSHNTDYRWVYAGDGLHHASTSTAVTLWVRSTSTIRASETVPNVGDVVRVHGVVSPAAAGLRVALQRRTSSGWQTVRSLSLSKTSGWSTSFTWKTTGKRYFRLVVPTTSRNLGGRSRVLNITVQHVAGLPHTG